MQPITKINKYSIKLFFPVYFLNRRYKINLIIKEISKFDVFITRH